MRTSSSFAGVGYNSDCFLDKTLSRLVNGGQVDFYFWIRHQADTDNTKDHVHLWIKPSGIIDTHIFDSVFDEVDLKHPEQKKPLKFRTYDKSKFDDAYLYFLHDERYLRAKHLDRNIKNYSPTLIHTNDPDWLQYKVSKINWAKIEDHNAAGKIITALNNNLSWSDFVEFGNVPAQQYAGYEKMWRIIEEEYKRKFYINRKTGEKCKKI